MTVPEIVLIIGAVSTNVILIINAIKAKSANDAAVVSRTVIAEHAAETNVALADLQTTGNSIHDQVNGNLSDMTFHLAEANEKIARLEGLLQASIASKAKS